MSANAARTGVFDAARDRVSIADLVAKAGVTLKRQGCEMRGPCPLCGSGAASKTAFAVREHHWRCFGSCDASGDVVDLEQRLRGGTPIEAALRLTGGDLPSGGAVARKAAEPPGPTASDRIAAELWGEGRPIFDPKGQPTLAARYLAARGIHPELIALAAPQLRYHPFAKWAWGEKSREWIKHPALIMQVITQGGPTGGVHATYLARSGLEKAPVSPAKRMWGPQKDRLGHPGGAWIIGPDGPPGSDLAVGEGLETTLSLASLYFRRAGPMRVLAALSLGRLQGGEAQDVEGCVDPYAAVPDPDRPALVWTAPAGNPWPNVLIAVDRDMAEVKVRGRSPRGKVVSFNRDAETRARLCGQLAVKAWTAAGAKARAVAPSPGCDFNDELRRLLAQERGV